MSAGDLGIGVSLLVSVQAAVSLFQNGLPL
jgi:hypothetical protein